jgi:hypothetical protein
MPARSDSEVRELAQRSNDGIEVTLLWNPATDGVFVVVEDRCGDSFKFDADAKCALEAFRHPYAYVSRANSDELRIFGQPQIETRN